MARPGFGTDGVRGVANVELTAELATALGRAATQVLRPAAFVVGRDTRESSPMLQAALAAGLAAEGADVIDVGVLPTAGVAYCAERRGVPAAMVSASHNPYTDNGIKFFDAAGIKLSPELESRVEAALDAILGAANGSTDGVVADSERGTADANGNAGAVAGAGAGSVGNLGAGSAGNLGADPGALGAYRRHLVDSLEGRRLDGLRVAVDCANGAAAAVAPQVLEELGATVHAICTTPDGQNINAACGSTHPSRLAETVTTVHADLGLALDGDADRLLAVDETGTVLDGDVLLAVFAVDLASRDQLSGNTVVVTVMTNLGFRRAMAERGITVHETPVGDRQVLAALDAGGLAIGGEQSGHIIFRRRATTGDGVLTGLLLADAVARSGQPLSTLARGLVERVPQVLVNVAVREPSRLEGAPGVWEAVAAVEAELGDRGRVLLRASGTEPLVRVMVEAPTAEIAADAAGRLRAAVEGSLGGG